MPRDDRFWAGGLAGAVGLLQAWDSGGFGGGAQVAWLSALGVLLPAAGLLITRATVIRIAALAAGVVLLTWARIVSPVPLNALHLSLFVPAIYLIVVPGMLRKRQAHV
jgi:hypothetical protein